MEKVLIITGASKGIGKALANEYHDNGYRVFSISRTKIDKLYTIEQFQCDLSDVLKIENVLKDIFKLIDGNNTKQITLLNNAGRLGKVSRVENISADDIQKSYNLNIIAPTILSSLFIKFTADFNCKRQIINISSGAAVKPYSGWTTYCTSKAALDMMTKTIYKEQKYIKNGVKVIAIYPGVVETSMQEQLRNCKKEDFRKIKRFIELKEDNLLSLPEDVAKQIYFLDTNKKIKSGGIIDIRNL